MNMHHFKLMYTLLTRIYSAAQHTQSVAKDVNVETVWTERNMRIENGVSNERSEVRFWATAVHTKRNVHCTNTHLHKIQMQTHALHYITQMMAYGYCHSIKNLYLRVRWWNDFALISKENIYQIAKNALSYKAPYAVEQNSFAIHLKCNESSSEDFEPGKFTCFNWAIPHFFPFSHFAGVFFCVCVSFLFLWSRSRAQ